MRLRYKRNRMYIIVRVQVELEGGGPEVEL